MRETTTSTNSGEYSITFYNVDRFLNGNPLIMMDKGLAVPKWFYLIGELLFGK